MPPASYALTDDNNFISTFYLWPVAKHCKPVLTMIRDEYGTTGQWVAPLRSNCKAHF